MYERAFLHFRSKVPEQVPPHAIDRYYENHVGPRLEALDDIFAATEEEYRAFSDAMEIYTNHERDGAPEEGGLDDQPALYMHALNTIRQARDNAEHYERQKAAHEAYQKAEEDRQEREAQQGGAVPM